jgi:DNA modification methylase
MSLKIEDVLNKVLIGDVIDILPTLPEKCIHSIVTSPPYFAVRNYPIEPTNWPEVKFSIFGFPITVSPMTCQLGQEKDPMHFIGHMVYVFRLSHRVLRDDGTIWMNMGDCYNSKSGGYSNNTPHGYHDYIYQSSDTPKPKNNRNIKSYGLKKKDMIGIPWMLAFALRDDGWYLR